MIKKGRILTTFCILVLAFSCFSNAIAAPEINVGLILEYEYIGTDIHYDTQVTYDNGTFWTLFTEFTTSSEYDSVIEAVTKSTLDNTYYYTQYNSTTGDYIKDAQGFMLWIDTTGLVIGENITLDNMQFKIMEQIELVIALGTFSVYNATHSSVSGRVYNYYDVNSGFLLDSYNPFFGLDLELSSNNSPSISEFPKIILPLILIPIIINVKKIKRI